MSSTHTISNEQIQDLMTKAREVVSRIPPNHDHTVSAAILTKDGKLVTGVNMSHFTGGPCAEPVAIATAVSHGYMPNELAAIVAMNKKRGVLNPCGRCRQQMRDLCPQIQVIVKEPSGEARLATIEELLPLAYVYPTESTQP
ncbi:hypothetical protein KVT40_009208 [Elsinoe batatas]|uniref:CMP/dCMP-type deaminase domain-containing protein n=1 Tax=Elsinoe batatas TaxID=2601811 RepID=A0A8K0KVU7_9PEZI|nr:hypothetical protein KVT40_009208 [Elsinoe batatas]